MYRISQSRSARVILTRLICLHDTPRRQVPVGLQPGASDWSLMAANRDAVDVNADTGGCTGSGNDIYDSTMISSGRVTQQASRARELRVVIVGAGCFGLSTAYHLLIRGYGNVTVLDRSTVLPAPDAASNDINRVVRSSYNDRFYAELAREAIDMWKDRNFWSDAYHESGVLLLGSENLTQEGLEAQRNGKVDDATVGSSTGTSTYADESFANDLALGCMVVPLPDPASIRLAFPSDVFIGSIGGNGAGVAGAGSDSPHRVGYLNYDGGWSDAGEGAKVLLSNILKLGAEVYPGKTVSSINKHAGKATGVSCSDGTVFDADMVIISTGSWTPSTFPDLGLQEKCLATGQCIAMIRLTEKEAKKYEGCPVVLDFTSGFYIFPPTAKNIIKMAIHGPGFTHRPDGGISTPRTILSDPGNGLAIPKASLRQLRSHLRQVYPDLAEKPFCGTRLCWYNDAPDGHWVVGRHPTAHNLVLATAGSGHAYKFLPVLGRLVADLIEDKLDPAIVAKFAVDRVPSQIDASRSGAVTELDLSQLCSPMDLDVPDHV